MAKVYKDLREFLATLEEEGQLVRVKEEVMPEPDIASAGRAAANIKNGPAVLFENINGYQGKVVTNVHGSWPNHALMMGMPKDTPVKRGEIRKQAKTLISSRFKDSGQTGYK